MLASIPIPSNTTSNNNNNNTIRYYNRYHTSAAGDWPLNELEENMMTLATCSQINHQKKAAAVAQLTSAWHSSLLSKHQRNTLAVVRCNTCQRKFHSQGNLANHQQLYQH